MRQGEARRGEARCRITSHHLASPRLASHHLASPRITSHHLASPMYITILCNTHHKCEARQSRWQIPHTYLTCDTPTSPTSKCHSIYWRSCSHHLSVCAHCGTPHHAHIITYRIGPFNRIHHNNHNDTHTCRPCQLHHLTIFVIGLSIVR